MTKKSRRHLGTGKWLKAQKAAEKVLSHAAYKARDRFEEVGEGLIEYVRTHPGRVLGLSLIAGIVLAQLNRFRKHL